MDEYNLRMAQPQIITISPDIQSGTPVFAGTRVPVKNFFDYLRGGDSVEAFLRDYPSVSGEQVDLLLQLMEKLMTLNPGDTHDKSAA